MLMSHTTVLIGIVPQQRRTVTNYWQRRTTEAIQIRTSGQTINLEHALSCPTEGVTISRHIEDRDLLAGLLTDICHDITLEPCLQPLSADSPHKVPQ